MDPEDVGRDFIEHYGVKGMRWGVVNDDEGGGPTDPVIKKANSDQSKSLKPDQKANLERNKKLHEKHFEPSEGDPKGWRPTGKQLAIVGVGALAVGGIIYANKVGNARIASEVLSVAQNPMSKDDYLGLIRQDEVADWFKDYAGKPISSKNYMGLVQNSTGRAWTNSHLTRSLLDQDGMELPVGHTFYRLSSVAEKGFGKATYATASQEDLARYVATFTGAHRNKILTFKANAPVRVPDLHTQLEGMRSALASLGQSSTGQDAVRAYSARSGGSWSDPISQSFFGVMRERGFSAMRDTMDTGVYGENPLVIFDHSNLTDKVAAPLTSAIRSSLTNNLTEITNRR